MTQPIEQNAQQQATVKAPHGRKRRIRPSVVISLVLAAAAGAWIFSGLNSQDEGAASPDAAAPAQQAAAPAPQKVTVIESTAQPYLAELVISGRTEAFRSVVLRAETDGAVTEASGEEGRPLKAGEILAKLGMEDRNARRAQAAALVEQRQIEVNAARKLSDRGFQSQTKLAEAEANLASARAALESIRVDIARTSITAPFEGVLAERMVELGDYVRAGDDIAKIVDLDPILLVAQVSEREVGHLESGLVGQADLITGEHVEGVVTMIAPSSSSATRTFRVEMEVANPGNTIREGLTAQISLPLHRVQAHRIAPSLLTLDDGGRIGVKSVTADGKAEFLPVTIAGDTPDAIWVTGLPDKVTLISVGQIYVSPGEIVEAVPEEQQKASSGEAG